MSLLVNQNEEEKKKGLGGLLGNLDSQSLLAFAASLQEQAAPSTTPQGGLRLAAPMLAYKQANEQQKQKQALNQLFEARGIPIDLPTDVALKLLGNNRQTKPSFQTFQNTSSQQINIGGRIIEPNGTFNIDSNTFYDPQNQNIVNAYNEGLIKPYKNENQQTKAISIKDFRNTSANPITINGRVIQPNQAFQYDINRPTDDFQKYFGEGAINIFEPVAVDTEPMRVTNLSDKDVTLADGTTIKGGATTSILQSQFAPNQKLFNDGTLYRVGEGREVQPMTFIDQNGNRYDSFVKDGRRLITDASGRQVPLSGFIEKNKDLKLKPTTTTEIGKATIPATDLVKQQDQLIADRNKLQALAEYASNVEGSQQGLAFSIGNITSKLQTFAGREADNIEKLYRGRLSEAQIQALLGRFRVEVVGAGVMTEQDAKRVLTALGGEAGAFRDKAVVDRLIRDIFERSWNSYNAQVRTFNKTIKNQRQTDQFKTFKTFDTFDDMYNTLFKEADKKYSINTELDETYPLLPSA